MSSSPVAPASEASAALSRCWPGWAGWPRWRPGRSSDDDLAGAVTALDQVTRLAQAHGTRCWPRPARGGCPARRGTPGWSTGCRAQVPTTNPRAAAAQARRAERLFTSAVAAELGPTREALLTGALSAEQADVVAGTVEALVAAVAACGVVPDVAGLRGSGVPHRAGGALRPDVGSAGSAAYLRAPPRPRRRRPPGSRRGRADQGAHADPGDHHWRHGARRGSAHPGVRGRPAHGPRRLDRTPARRRRSLTLDRPRNDATTASSSSPSGPSPPRAAARPRTASRTGSSSRSRTRPWPRALDGTAVTGLPPATMPDGAAVSSTTLATLSCTAELLPVVIDGLGNPLDVGRTQRSFTARQRHALAVRDRGCTWPGCTAPPEWTDAHHLQPWSEGGVPTSTTPPCSAATTTGTSTAPPRPGESSTAKSPGTPAHPGTASPAPPDSSTPSRSDGARPDAEQSHWRRCSAQPVDAEPARTAEPGGRRQTSLREPPRGFRRPRVTVRTQPGTGTTFSNGRNASRQITSGRKWIFSSRYVVRWKPPKTAMARRAPCRAGTAAPARASPG